MPERHSSALLETPLVQVHDVLCHAPRSGYGPVELGAVGQVVLPRRGVFVVERSGEPQVIDTNAALVVAPDEEYRVSHPAAGGDACTVFVLPPDLLDEAAGGVGGRLGSLRPRHHLAVCFLTRALRDSALHGIEAEESSLLLLAALSRAFATRGSSDREPLGPLQRARLEEVRALLASSPSTRWDLRSVGRAVHCSPFHLARQFRMATGETISHYLLRVRLGVAVERLGEGERDLAALALDVGFAHHSHFSARFRRVFGITPAAARDMLTRSRIDQLRVVVADGAPALR